jgi:hypothetical protein
VSFLKRRRERLPLADRRSQVVAAAVLALGTLMVIIIMRPGEIFSANTPAGGDMGAHVFVPAMLRDSLLPDGRILGWSNSWYAGFPVMYFYFPLPALTVVALDLFVPYGVAFKLVTIAGLAAMPYAAYYFTRSMGFSRPVSVAGGLAGFSFIFMEQFSIFGGNTLSTLAGEYSFSWSFTLSLVYLGMIIRNTREGKGFTAGPAIVLALTAMSHIITTLMAVLASLPLLLRRKGASTVTGSWGLGFGLAAFWAVPLLARAPSYSNDMGWQPVRGIQNVIWPVAAADGTCTFPCPSRELLPVVILGLGGLIWAASRRKWIGPAIAMAVIPIVAFFGIEYLHNHDMSLGPFKPTIIYNARLLPYWYFVMFLFAGVFAGMAAVALVRRLRARPLTLWLGGSLAAVLFLVVIGVGVHKTPAWATWNYSGYEAKCGGWEEDGSCVADWDYWGQYSALMAEIDALPDGRVMWEYNRDQGKYGTPMALMLTDYWAEGHPSMEGLFFESSITTPFHFLNQSELSHRPSSPQRGLQYRSLDLDRGVAHLMLYGVSYYVTYTEEATTATEEYGLEFIAAVDPFRIYRVPESALVEVGAYEPAVWDGPIGFRDDGGRSGAALEWYDDYEHLDRWLVADGPAEWQRIDDVSRTSRRLTGADPDAVSDIVVDDHRISFRTTAVGEPHLVKVSYFPNWTATGALGPYEAAPSLMIVVPTEEEVVIEFANTWPEKVGMILSVAGVAVIGLLVVLDRRRRRPGADV